MSTLNRYLLLQSLYYLLLCLVTCVGIYLLVDVFDRLDRFLEKQSAAGTIIAYFLFKIPLILSQILPAVFFLALLVQISQMGKQRELIALEASGISYSRVIVFFLIYALFWSGLQLFFSQFLGVAGETKSERIWDNLGKEQQTGEKVVSDIWFRQGLRLVHVERIKIKEGRGDGIEIFRLQKDFKAVDTIVRARKFEVRDNDWRLFDVRIFEPMTFSQNQARQMSIPLDQDLDIFEVLKDAESPEKMSLWRLRQVIQKLKDSGANVDFLLTAWHMKIAYAFSILVLSCIGLIMGRQRDNAILNITYGLGVIFVYYFVHVIGGSLGENGVVPPYAGAWLANALIGIPAFFLLMRRLQTR
ncbi:MAG: LptF/LptG family permease [Desulfohalobiaceae bacterium]|nr:LptF/LptG family permease [Desulfohalobiaceae bacterium]